MVGVVRSREGGRRRWCRFNASVLTREWRWRDEALPEDEVEETSLSWLHGKEAWHDTMVWQRWSEERRHQGGERKEMTLVGLTRILLGQKWRKFTWSIQLLLMDGENLKQWWVNFFKTYTSEIYFYSSHHIEHNSKTEILNKYHTSEINHFKVLLLCKMMWYRCWYDMTWLNTDANTLHVKKINLNNS
jgi:hypothetical protein